MSRLIENCGRKTEMLKRIIVFILCFSFCIDTYAVSASYLRENRLSGRMSLEETSDSIVMDENESEKDEIVGFDNFEVGDHYIRFYDDERPSLEQVVSMMPKSLMVFFRGESEARSIPVSWYAITEDYENQDKYYYQFNPKWDNELYELSKDIDEYEDVPYIGVFIESSAVNKRRAKSGTPVTGKANETAVYNFLRNNMNVNTAVACGVLANIQCESAFNPNSSTIDTNNLQSYGLCQWNGGRNTALRSYCQNNGYSYSSVEGQMRYLQHELSTSEKSAWSKISGQANTSSGAYNAGYNWAKYFERCAEYYNGRAQFVERANLARDNYWPAYSSNPNPEPEPNIRNYYTPLTCYTVSTGNVTTYTSASGSTVSGYITGSTDQCVISKVYVNGRVEVTYPTPSGPKLAYANLSDFISNSYAVTNYNYSVSSNTDVYRRKDLSETIGKAFSTDSIVVVGESEGLLQIIYPISGGYKLGWINGNSSSSGGSSGSGSSYSVDSRFPTPISAYTNKSSNVTTYSAVNGGATGAIFTTDLCTISEVYTNGWCKVTYPTSSTPKTAYTEFSNFLDTGCSVTPANYNPGQTLTVYTRKDLSATFGSVWSTDNCKTVASTGNLRQIIYPLDAGGYKMGWINLPVSTPTVNWPMPLKAYINSATDRAAVYESINTNPGYGQIFVDDLCTINAVYENGWVNVTYPTSSTPKTGYVPLSVFVPNQVTAYSVTAAKQIISYQKSNMATQFGYADPGDNCIIVGRSGDKVQMIYPITGGYKLGWAYANDFTKTLTGLSVGTKPAKTSYIEGESLNTSGLVIKASYSDNTTASVTGYTLSGYSSTPGEKTVTVSYSEGGVTKTTAFSVTVAAKTPTKLTITKAPSKVTYLEGQDSFDFSDMAVTVTYNNGASAAVTGYELFGMSTAVGTHPITVKYTENGVSVNTTFTVTVKQKSLISLNAICHVEESEDFTVGCGSELDLSLITVIAEYDNGDYEEITDYTVQGFDSERIGSQTITIAYKGLSAELNVLVVSLTSVMTDPDMILPEDLIVIEKEAFCGCKARWIRLSENVVEIGDRAFADSVNLEQIYIPESTVKISLTAFENHSNILTIYAKDGSYAEFFANKNGFGFVPVE